MTKLTIRFITAVLLGALVVPAVHAKTAAELLREGLYAEEVEGDLDQAIGIYQQIILDTAAPRNLVAQAMLRQGTCLLKKKREQEAREVFEKLVTDYGDQTEVVEKVKPMLEELGNADPASLMPPETLAYIEIGSPGRQVETILNMLKGTPFENALASLNRGMNQGGAGKGPAAMLAGLLNPSMMAEFKKIRSLGVGVTELAQNNPLAIVVLFPGQSDALRGLLQTILTAVGTSAEPIEGMTVVSFPSGGGAAFDQTVIIAVTPSPRANELLQQAVRRHKGRTGLPSLASQNKSFSRISKQERQQNALTLWMNVDEAYGRLTKMLPADQVPQHLRMANHFIDFQNVDDLIATLSLRETGVALAANIGFKDGNQSLFYNLIRTPSLSMDALKAIPAEAVALVSLTLGGAGTPQAQAVGEKIKAATGLDLGSQIFGNLEQITLFAVPPREVVAPANPQMPLIAQSLGLAIISKNPQQTQQLLVRLLQGAKLVPADVQAADLIPAAGRFDVGLADDGKLFGYTDQASRTMLLSPSVQVIETSVAALKQDTSVVTGGKLRDALATVSPNTSKLVLVNVGGLLRLAAPSMMNFPSEETTQEARKSLDEVIKASEKTTLRLQTTEEADNFNIRLSVSDLPPMNQVIGPISRIAKMVDEAKAGMAAAEAKARAATSIPQAPRAPVIDGNADEVWAGVPSHEIGNVAYSAPAGPQDVAAEYKAMYDRQALYILVDVTDDQLTNDSVEFWLDDGVEVFIDADNSKSDVYGENDYQFHFDWDSTSPTMGESKQNKTDGVRFAFARTDKGYRAEIKLPWSTLGAEPTVGARFGFDIHVNDDDDGGDRDTKLMGFTRHDVAWQEPKALGTGELAGLVAWWKLDERDGRTAADSSGNGHDAAVQGNPTWRPAGGRVGGAIALDGDGDFLEVANESAFDFTGGVTVAAWIRAESLDKPWQAIITKGEWAWRLQRNEETNTLEFACSGVHVPSESAYGSLYGTRELKLGEWCHAAGTYDGKRMALYVDGALDTAQAAWGPVGVDDEPVLIGENAAEKGRFWNGLIDDIRIYNYGLTESQVKELYNQGK